MLDAFKLVANKDAGSWAGATLGILFLLLLWLTSGGKGGGKKK